MDLRRGVSASPVITKGEARRGAGGENESGHEAYFEDLRPDPACRELVEIGSDAGAEIAHNLGRVRFHLYLEAIGRRFVGGPDRLQALQRLAARFDGDGAEFGEAGAEPFEDETERFQQRTERVGPFDAGFAGGAARLIEERREFFCKEFSPPDFSGGGRDAGG